MSRRNYFLALLLCLCAGTAAWYHSHVSYPSLSGHWHLTDSDGTVHLVEFDGDGNSTMSLGEGWGMSGRVNPLKRTITYGPIECFGSLELSYHPIDAEHLAIQYDQNHLFGEGYSAILKRERTCTDYDHWQLSNASSYRRLPDLPTLNRLDNDTTAYEPDALS